MKTAARKSRSSATRPSLRPPSTALSGKRLMPYLDVVRAARDRFGVPMGAYQVSGEYSMLQAAFEKGWLDRDRAMLESLVGIRRAGADFIVTYFAKDAAKLL